MENINTAYITSAEGDDIVALLSVTKSSMRRSTALGIAALLIAIAAICLISLRHKGRESESPSGVTMYDDARLGFSLRCPEGTEVILIEDGVSCSMRQDGPWIGSISVESTTSSSVDAWVKDVGLSRVAGAQVVGKRSVSGIEGILVYVWPAEARATEELEASKHLYLLHNGKVYTIAYRSYAPGFESFLSMVDIGDSVSN